MSNSCRCCLTPVRLASPDREYWRELMFIAVVGNGAAAVEWLWDHGVRPGRSVLRCAIEMRNDRIASLLVRRGAPLPARALTVAVARGLVVTALQLVERASHLIADAMSDRDFFFCSCVHADFLPIAGTILANFPAYDLSACRTGRVHPLIVACDSGLLGHVELLIEHGAPVNQASEFGTALHFAVNRGHGDIVKRLLAAGMTSTMSLVAGETSAQRQ
jgi:hypothetical protein